MAFDFASKISTRGFISQQAVEQVSVSLNEPEQEVFALDPPALVSVRPIAREKDGSPSRFRIAGEVAGTDGAGFSGFRWMCCRITGATAA